MAFPNGTGTRLRRTRYSIKFPLPRWLSRQRSFQSVEDDLSTGKLGIFDVTNQFKKNEHYDDKESESEEEPEDDEISGYLDITIEDLSKNRRLSSHLDPITEEDIIVLNSPPPSPLFLNARGTIPDLKPPSALFLSRTRLLSPRNESPSSPQELPFEELNVASSTQCGSIAPTNISMMRLMKPPPPDSNFLRIRTLESFQESLESLDSLAESYWDPEDDTSLTSPNAADLTHSQSSEFLFEHVRFLNSQTQPRQVEVVWSTPPRSKSLSSQYF